MAAAVTLAWRVAMRCSGVGTCHAVATVLRRLRLLRCEARLRHTSGCLPEGLDREAGILGAIGVLLVNEQDALAGRGERTAGEPTNHTRGGTWRGANCEFAMTHLAIMHSGRPDPTTITSQLVGSIWGSILPFLRLREEKTGGNQTSAGIYR